MKTVDLLPTGVTASCDSSEGMGFGGLMVINALQFDAPSSRR